MKDINGKTLKAGQICKVHPSDNSIAREPFYVEIKRRYLFGALWTSIPDGHDALINQYLLSRLEIIGDKGPYQHYLYGQELHELPDSFEKLFIKAAKLWQRNLNQ